MPRIETSSNSAITLANSLCKGAKQRAPVVHRHDLCFPQYGKPVKHLLGVHGIPKATCRIEGIQVKLHLRNWQSLDFSGDARLITFEWADATDQKRNYDHR